MDLSHIPHPSALVEKVVSFAPAVKDAFERYPETDKNRMLFNAADRAQYIAYLLHFNGAEALFPPLKQAGGRCGGAAATL